MEGGGALTTRRFSRRVAAADAGRRLESWSQEWLSGVLARPVSRSEIRRWIMAGAVRLEGARPRSPGAVIEAGRRVAAAVRAEAVAGPRPTAPGRLLASQILFEDEFLVVVDKPPGIPTHETADPRRPHLVGLLTRLLAERARGEIRLGVHQRLDRDTSGVILFSKDRSADPGLARQFAGRAVSKTYHAFTERPKKIPPERWTVVGPVGPAGKETDEEARTDFRRLEVFERALLVEARPHTGRKHQIRVHLAQGGLAILGDDRYGRPRTSETPAAPRLMLHASRLELRHPVSGAPLVIECAWPSDFLKMAAALRAAPAEPERGRGRSSPR